MSEKGRIEFEKFVSGGRIAELEARLASQDRALGVAVGALKLINAWDPEDGYVTGSMSREALCGTITRMGDKAREALTQIEGEGER